MTFGLCLNRPGSTPKTTWRVLLNKTTLWSKQQSSVVKTINPMTATASQGSALTPALPPSY